ncbi:MAG: aminotransferase class V-fold PLP-dependent enzyme, partial [Pseudomonadota bacterium]|nr:aminotransferase class V-fold PLP-dependent enzyme [Pseudomonadota bacterium]
AQSLNILERVGAEVIESHVTRLSHVLIEGLLEQGLPVAGGEPGPHSGSIVCIGRVGAGGHDSTDDQQIAALSRGLEEGGVVHTIRRGMIRLAFHLYNNDGDVERVLDIARKYPIID